MTKNTSFIKFISFCLYKNGIKSKKEEKKSNKNDDGMSIEERIEKLELQISDLCSSSVYQTIDKMHISLVTSPIKKTNVILKNVNFQYALTLWNYMQTHMEDDVKKEKKNKDYYDEGRLRKCIDESFLLDYLVLNSINNDNSSVDKNALSEKIAFCRSMPVLLALGYAARPLMQILMRRNLRILLKNSIVLLSIKLLLMKNR